MTSIDLEYFKKCYDLGLIQSPFLEVGSAKMHGDEMPNLCELALSCGVKQAVGVDLQQWEGVDFTADFAVSPDVFAKSWNRDKFATVAIFNVLEHTFDPFTVLTNVLSCVAEGGTLLALTPTVWGIHNYPRDYNRLLPDWYEEFARIKKITVRDEAFCWLSNAFGIYPVSMHKEDDTYVLPGFPGIGKKQSPMRYWASRIVHKLFNTFGRSHPFTYVALGVTYSC